MLKREIRVEECLEALGVVVGSLGPLEEEAVVAMMTTMTTLHHPLRPNQQQLNRRLPCPFFSCQKQG